MGIISKRMQDQIRQYQQETGETARCFSEVSISREIWDKIVRGYGISEEPVEVDATLEEYYWENPDATVRLLTKGDPMESGKPVTEITVFAGRKVVESGVVKEVKIRNFSGKATSSSINKLERRIISKTVDSGYAKVLTQCLYL